MASADPITTIPVHRSTLGILQQVKTGAQNWDEFLRSLLERIMDLEEEREALHDLALLRADVAAGRTERLTTWAEVRREVVGRRNRAAPVRRR